MPRVAVAFSGGRDSTALLLATARQATGLGLDVVALHVHHGLLPEADAWVLHAESVVRELQERGFAVTLNVQRLTQAPGPGVSVEAWAREQRYQALSAMATQAGASLILLGHHLDDQAETVLIQALRGAGLPGLSGMPSVVRQSGLTWARPWLGMSGEVIQAYVQTEGLAVVIDPSNADARFTRNRLRKEVLPVLKASFPQASQAMAQSARWAQDAQSCLLDLAMADLASLRTPQERLNREGLLALSLPRLNNALRFEWHRCTGQWPSRTVLDQLPAAMRSRRASLRLEFPGQWRFCVHRSEVWIERMATVTQHGVEHASDSGFISVAFKLDRLGVYEIPGWTGRLWVAARSGRSLLPTTLIARARQGGEVFSLGRGRPVRSLKLQFQAMGIPAWSRSGPLLLASSGELIMVPGLGVQEEWAEAHGVDLQWMDVAAPGSA